MRLWTIHPKYLDRLGLVALWREGLLARKVLLGETSGYKNHPQLDRFKKTENPINSINYYLVIVFLESGRRRYKFDHTKVVIPPKPKQIEVFSGQVRYECKHLGKKLIDRTGTIPLHVKYPRVFGELVHPLFKIKLVNKTESWEVIK